MNAIDLKATADRALELMLQKGTSVKSLHNYTHTGFGGIIRSFEKNGK